MASLVTRVASKHRTVMIAVFALSARVWIDEVTDAIHRSRDLAQRVQQLEEWLDGERVRLDVYDEAANRQRVADFQAAGAEITDDGVMTKPAPRPGR